MEAGRHIAALLVSGSKTGNALMALVNITVVKGTVHGIDNEKKPFKAVKGQTVTVDDAEAADLIEKGVAKLVEKEMAAKKTATKE